MKKYIPVVPFMEYFLYSRQFMWILILSQILYNINIIVLEIIVPDTLVRAPRM